MNPIIALALTTPVWGFALQPPTPPPVIAPVQLAQLQTLFVSEEHRVRLEDVELEAESHNRSMMEWTRSMSAVTVVVFAATAVLGAIQFGDEYGFHSDQSHTACATGEAVFGRCGEATPWPHVIGVIATAGLGLTTFILSTQVDYELAERHDGDWRTYEVTRWVGLGMFVVQALGGFLLANAVRFGWADEQKDFDTFQAFAIAHLALGATTLGVEIFNTAILF